MQPETGAESDAQTSGYHITKVYIWIKAQFANFVKAEFAFIRAELVPKYFWEYPNSNKLDKLFNSRDFDVLKNLAIFCSYITEFFKHAVPWAICDKCGLVFLSGF